MHFFVYTIGQKLRDKTSDIGKPGMDVTTKPSFEVHASSKFLLYVAPGMHAKSGRRLIVGTYTPAVLGVFETRDWQQHMDDILKKYGLVSTNGNGNGDDVSMHDLFLEETTVYEGDNRHRVLMRVMESMIKRNRAILPMEQIISICRQWNRIHCSPPLDESQFQKQWTCATNFFTSGKATAAEDESSSGSNSNSDSNSDSCSNSKKNKDKDQKKRYEYVQVFKDKNRLAEALLIDGKSFFAVVNLATNEIKLEKEIQLDDEQKTTLKPSSADAYINIAYSFDSEEQFHNSLDMAKHYDFDALYVMTGKIWDKYIDAEKEHISLCAQILSSHTSRTSWE